MRYIWDEDVILQEVRDGDEFAPGSLISTVSPLCVRSKNGAIYSIVTDGLGTPTEVVDERGVLVWSASYRTWGHADHAITPGVDCPVRFPGQWFDDESGLHYNRFRYYDPAIGRYISPDPIGLFGSYNPYVYACNPLAWFDPLGGSMETAKTAQVTIMFI